MEQLRLMENKKRRPFNLQVFVQVIPLPPWTEFLFHLFPVFAPPALDQLGSANSKLKPPEDASNKSKEKVVSVLPMDLQGKYYVLRNIRASKGWSKEMTAGKRVKNVVIDRAVVYGSSAAPLKKNDIPADPSHTHRWTVYVRGLHGEDISYYVKKVLFKLHDSFPNPNRIVDKHPFEVSETGWGEFEIPIKVFFNDSAERPVTLYHHLQLYPKDELALQSKKPVVAEHYEEIVFSEPTEEMHEILTSNPSPTTKKLVSDSFTPQTEQEELRKIAAAQEKVSVEIDRYRSMLRKAEENLKNVQAEVKELESG
ncbi:YEATS domain-containing protein 4 [Quaeritorhiza haematococci]|nr:YEATS domain-containing protein 4 [Quaeritorhiza haematococci]